MKDYSTINEVLSSTQGIRSMLATLIVLVCINIILELIKFGTSIYISKKDKENKRQLLIEEKRIKVLEALFKMLDSLTLYERTEMEKMLNDLKEISLYITQNKLYIPTKMNSISNELLDYFKNVLTDYRQKSIERETELFQKFCNEFNK
ncbi:hypothetical protein QWY31_05975 [Cytophagales bacterium LB-30]|uniref:Uncharacterized protein n=1 Tax=Shiella aurantiaca TaxID=3058365 RepID=A0ABT8F495_9BACT|nr:hypothetical protein [Shiella aurantiaca]MDN4165041.1 hypothetical protein [Shiella aurantiaca]